MQHGYSVSGRNEVESIWKAEFGQEFGKKNPSIFQSGETTVFFSDLLMGHELPQCRQGATALVHDDAGLAGQVGLRACHALLATRDWSMSRAKASQ
jgi:hypothetical protein